jgi:acetamidase/formamidase family protein
MTITAAMNHVSYPCERNSNPPASLSDTMSHQGLTTNADPVTYFGRAGIKPEEVLQDAKDIYAKVPRGKGLSVHVLTGPIYIEGAEPGDALEVRVLDLEFRVPYGVNNTGPGSGVLPDLVPTSSPRVIQDRFAAQGGVPARRHRAAAWAVPRHYGGCAAARPHRRLVRPAEQMGWQS